MAVSSFRFGGYNGAMKENHKIVLSASRRTDIPAFYMDWFMAGIRQGFFEVTNPYNQQTSMVPASPDQVHSIVFWSKDFGRFLRDRLGERLREMGFGLFFHFTLNTESPILEPNVPPIAQRLAQMAALAERFSPQAVTWRFDPICHYLANGISQDNLDGFWAIAEAAAGCGLSRCVTSFADLYRKVEKRAARVPGFSFVTPGLEERARILRGLETGLSRNNIALFTCCEKQVWDCLGPDTTTRPSACIDHGLLERLYGPGLSGGQDKGQRRSAGCGCMKSLDVGSYAAHPCFHNCLFCYAAPAPPKARDGRPPARAAQAIAQDKGS